MATRQPPGWVAWQMFFESHAAVTARLEADLQARHGFGLRWYDVLLHLHAAPRRTLTMGELGDAVVISKSGLTGLVERMRLAGMLTRETDANDRRVSNIRLTDAGARAYRRARLDHRRGVAELFLERLEGEEAAVLARSLERIRDQAAGRRSSRTETP